MQSARGIVFLLAIEQKTKKRSVVICSYGLPLPAVRQESSSVANNCEGSDGSDRLASTCPLQPPRVKLYCLRFGIAHDTTMAVGERPPRSHQFRALSRRTATYHRRQWKLDLCCLGLCPASVPLRVAVTYRSISVIIAGVLGFVARHFADLSSGSNKNSTSLLQGGIALR